MSDETESEIAIAIALALAERMREQALETRKAKSSWKRSAGHRMPTSWKRTTGWASASRHEGVEGMKGR